MKKFLRKGFLALCLLACVFVLGMPTNAQEGDTIKKGIFAGNIDLSGLSAEDAKQAIEAYVEALRQVDIVLLSSANTEVTVKAGEFGITWTNPGLVEDALAVGADGNVIERYKIIKDLEYNNLVYPIELSYDLQAINDVLTDKCAIYDKERVDSTLVRENGEFVITEGQTGYMLDVETSIDLIYDFLVKDWDYNPSTIALDVVVDDYRGTLEEMQQVKDVLGTSTTSYKTSGASRSANVQNGSELIDGTLLFPGDEFSTYDAVAPFTVENGYYMAGSYVSGKVVDSLGGGICQVSTTLYNAVLLSELEITERHNHSMTVSYVPLAADAAIAESSGKDFRFVNNLDYPIYIESYVKDKTITFTIYGKETRSADRKISFETVVLQEINAPADSITPDAGKPIGYITTASGYRGYKTQLWKVVTENGVEVSRTQVNTSNYKMVPRSAVVGTQTADPRAYEEIMAAIGTYNIDHVKNVIAILTAPPVEDSEEEY